jgi:hypothetical protein
MGLHHLPRYFGVSGLGIIEQGISAHGKEPDSPRNEQYARQQPDPVIQNLAGKWTIFLEKMHGVILLLLKACFNNKAFFREYGNLFSGHF